MLPNIPSLLLLTIAALSSTLAAPTPCTFDPNRTIPEISVQQLLAAAPKICTIVTEECHPAPNAVKEINTALAYHGLTALGQKAALLGLMTVESGDFIHNTNKNPGRPGQGTKAMLMFPHIYDYALSQPALTAEVLRISGGEALDVTFDNMDKIPAADQRAILALVLPEKYTYAAAAWYLENKCQASMTVRLAEGGFEGFKEYVGVCIGAGNVTPERLAAWCLAVKALKPVRMGMPRECNN
ncbi:hypothetical protein C7212DRAFT_301372 [Tuber magnatum]|uniref:Uncharacterized protein n=1 Tax=Tuber magnatum TaxID=42249 RepID=A0A317SIY7_9PEZI|nr:hypothetical protein C7212DRAFT_301372 [Tuber magnatum]